MVLIRRFTALFCNNMLANADRSVRVQNHSPSITQLPCTIPGKHSYAVRGVTFTVDRRYRLIKPIGVGAYGVVMSAKDLSTGNLVAIKKISGIFDDMVDAKRILREIRLMRALKHENILPVIDMEAPESFDEFDSVYITSPLYDKDLGKILSTKVKLGRAHKQYFIYQILRALSYLHRRSILHRDLKPANILIQESCHLALCDFGLARYIDSGPGCGEGMTEYVITRWYRAPELVLTHSYSSAVDLWAVGCILGELLTGKVVFPGRDFTNQVELICEVLGKPKGEDIAHVTSGRAKRFLNALPENGEGTWETKFGLVEDRDGVDLMKRLLRFDPKKRLTAEEALKHEYVREYWEDEDSHDDVANERLEVRELEPNGQLQKEDFKRLMLKEIYGFRPNASIFKSGM